MIEFIFFCGAASIAGGFVVSIAAMLGDQVLVAILGAIARVRS